MKNWWEKIRKKWLNDSDNNRQAKGLIISTNDKLNQIINSNRNSSKIQDQFFKTFDKEPLFKKIIKKDNEDEIFEKNNSSFNDISSKIKNIIDKRKKFYINDIFLKRRHEENNKQPPLCLYNPNYNYLYKHIPGFKIEKSTSRENISDKRYNLENININNKKKYNLQKDKIKINSSLNLVNKCLTPNNSSNKKTVNKTFITYIDVKNQENPKENELKQDKKNISLNKFHNNISLSQIGSPINNESKNKISFSYNPKFIEKNVLVPNFDKMMPRFLKPKKSGTYINLDYSPNYNAIFPSVLDNKPIDFKRRRKYYNLKKIIAKKIILK